MRGKRIDLIAAEYSTLPAVDFARAVNEIYYARSAAKYDSTHPDIFYDAAMAWRRIIDVLEKRGIELSDYSIIDVGAGTGFIATILVERGLSFKKYLGFEPSADMRIEAAKKFIDARISFHPIDASTKKAIGEALRRVGGNKIITVNSVLHHIVWWEEFLHSIKNILAPGDLLILCHEPNNRFWENEILVRYFDKILEKKAKRDRRAFYLNPRSYIRKIKKLMNIDSQMDLPVSEIINHQLKSLNAIRKDLPPQIISAIIDYSVPLCWRGIEIGEESDEGFYTIENLIRGYFQDMEVLLSFTYQHLGFSHVVIPSKWSVKEKDLEKEYPLDGAQLCLVLQNNRKPYDN